MMIRRLMVAAVTIVALVMMAVAAFAWGFLTIRNRVFPYALVRSITDAVGIPLREETRPRTAATDTEMLTALGYVHSQYDPDHERKGVLFYDPALAEQGLNFYVCVDHPTATLMDMSGGVLYGWTSPRTHWHHAELLPTGELYVVVTDRGVAKLDAHSRELWFFETGAHHDLWVHDDQSVFVLSRQRRRHREIRETRAIVEETLIRLSPEGEV